MAFDEQLAERIRAHLAAGPAVTEMRMFGGLAFLVGGNMAVAASGQGGLLVRVDPERSDELAERPGVEPMRMRGREMRGWLLVDSDEVVTDEALAGWIERGMGYARTLPSKS